MTTFQRRCMALQELGCIVSFLYLGRKGVPGDIHHLVEGNRLGNEYAICLHPWFHRGICPDGSLSVAHAEDTWGPSLALNKRFFIERFGTERSLLGRTNYLLEENGLI